jgi:hypothetical protein
MGLVSDQMSETTSNVEFAHKFSEQSHHPSAAGLRGQWVEIVEAIVLAIVAVTTAWSGYQAARWEALSAKNYAIATRTTVEAQEGATLAGQNHLYDIITFQGWMNAKSVGNEKLAAIYERRFRPEFLVAFTAWQKLNPFNSSSAPPGPTFMAEYADAHGHRAAELSKRANAYFEEGVTAREHADSYVKITVFLATVLLLTALSQRFKSFGPRVAVLGVAFIMLVISAYWIFSFPRA